MSKPLLSPNFPKGLVHWNFLFLTSEFQLRAWLEMLELLLARLWADCFFGVSENYGTWLIRLEPKSGIESTLPNQTLPLGISHLVGNFHAHISSYCREPCDFS
jgi:hypothetical protein